MDAKDLEEFGDKLRQHVPSISDVDKDRILAVAADQGKNSLAAIAEGMAGVTRDSLSYSLGKLYDSTAVPGINNVGDLRAWGQGLIKDPFERSINIVKEFTDLRPTDTVLAVYGSCLNPHSLARTTGQDPYDIEYLPAQLENYVVEWDAPSRRLNYSDADWKSLDEALWLWLAIRRTGNPADVVNGALVKLRGPEYHKMRARESHYHEIDVTDDILVDERHWGNYFRSLNNGVITFGPDLSKTVNDRTGKRVAVRAGYYDRTEEYLRKIHPDKETRLPKLPEGVELLEGYPTDDRVAEEYWEKIEKPLLDSYHSRVDKELYNNDVTSNTSTGAEPIPWGMRPVILNERTYNAVEKASVSAVTLSAKSHRLVLEDQRLFDLNGYTDIDRRLTNPQLANNFADLPTVARVDLALHGDKLIVFEVNADSAAGMFHRDKLAELQWREIESRKLTGDLVDVLKPPRNEGVCESIVEAFSRGWKQFLEMKADQGPREAPRRIAIVDRNIDSVLAYTEFEHFRELLLKHIYGIVEGSEENNKRDEVIILDIRDLRYREDHQELTDSSGRPIDAIYKRLLWQEAIAIGMGGLDDPLCRAYLDNSVFVMNSFRSRLTGSKLNMAIAKTPSFEARCNGIGIQLTDDERDVLENNIPETLLWGPASLDDRGPEDLKPYVMDNITDWVLKRHHGMGGQEFINGAPPTGSPAVVAFQERWDDGRFIAQRRQEHGTVSTPVHEGRQRGTVWDRYPFILGAYVIEGRCVAIEAKFAKDIPININQGGRRTAVFSLKK